jgi:hypothetical protein
MHSALFYEFCKVIVSNKPILNYIDFNIPYRLVQGAAERTPRFGRSVAKGRVEVEQWGVRR